MAAVQTTVRGEADALQYVGQIGMEVVELLGHQFLRGTLDDVLCRKELSAARPVAGRAHCNRRWDES